MLCSAPAFAAEPAPIAQPSPASPESPPAAEEKAAPPEDKDHPRCRIVQSRLSEDGKSLIMYIDGGHKKHFKKGAKGYLLKDKKGDTLLPGGEFEMTMVVDSWNSIARADGKIKLPKHGRCYIDLTTAP